MRHSIVFKTISVVLLIVLFSVGALNAIYIQNAKKEIIYAAGLELVGCANITTGLIDTILLEKAIEGNQEARTELSNTINWTVEKKHIFESHYILSLDGNVLAADKTLHAQGFQPGDSFHIEEKHIQAVIEGHHSAYTNVYEFGGVRRITGYAPIYRDHDPTKEVIAINTIDFHGDIINERLWEMIKSTLLISFALPFIAALITGIYMNRMFQPIHRITKVAEEITNKNLAVKNITLDRKDELGKLSKNMNQMKKTLSLIVSNMKNTSSTLSNASLHLKDQMNELTISKERVVASVEVVQEGSIEQAMKAEQTLTSLETFSKEIHMINTIANQALLNSNESETSAQKGIEGLVNFKRKMNEIASHADVTLEGVFSLEKMTDEIRQMVKVISDITVKTNMLALNASIEASRAGENGRGFTVVANEVRELSSATNEATERIKEISLMMGSIVNKTVDNVNENQLEVKKGVQEVEEVIKSFQLIGLLTKKTSEEMMRMLHHLEIANNQLNGVDKLMHLTKQSAERANIEAEEMSATTEEQAAMYDEISRYSSELYEVAKNLDKVINEFNQEKE